MSQSFSKVIVIGGGSAGWISAAMLAASFKRTGRDIQVELIESANIPTIGVGEGTFPTILNTLYEIGLSEKDFLTECEASYKQGALFRNWLYNPDEQEHAYYHPFDPPETPKGIDLTGFWVRQRQQTKTTADFAHSVGVQAHLCDANLAPKDNATPDYAWMAKYAYHLDAAKLGDIIKKHATEQLSVKHSYAEICDVQLDDEGFILSVSDTDEKYYAADFFIDCSGFRSLLLGEALNVPFIDKSQYLAVDHAVVLQAPYSDPQEASVTTHTIATAQPAGWIWDIALQNRRGTGYVYSSRHCSKEQAEKTLLDYHGISNRDALRHIAFTSGYRELSWKNNCVAIGFSSGFVEPLEATAIAMVDAGVRSLAANFPTNRAAAKVRQKHYNRIFTSRWDNIIDFIKLHYCLTQRNDTDFWREQTDPKTIPASLQEKLETWKHYGATEGDFPNRYDIFSVASWKYIIYGMDYLPEYVECASLPPTIEQKAFAAIQAKAASAKQKLARNGDLLRSYRPNSAAER